MSMPESTDLIRRLEAAINNKTLHPDYARTLLREAKEALEAPRVFRQHKARPVTEGDEPPEQIVLNCGDNLAGPAYILRMILSAAGGIETCDGWVRDLTTWYGGAYIAAADLPLTDEGAREPT